MLAFLGKRIISHSMVGAVVERLAVPRGQDHSKQIRHCLGSEIGGVGGDGRRARASQVEELSYNRHSEATESITHTHTHTHEGNEQ